MDVQSGQCLLLMAHGIERFSHDAALVSHTIRKAVHILYANNIGTDQLAHLHSLIITFLITF